MKFTVSQGKDFSEALEDMFACTLPEPESSSSHYDITDLLATFGAPEDTMYLALLALQEKLKVSDPLELLKAVEKGAYLFSPVIDLTDSTNIAGGVNVEKVRYKGDTLYLDVMPEQTLVQFLLSAELLDDGEVLQSRTGQPYSHMERNPTRISTDIKTLRAVISEECGVFPSIGNLADVNRLFILDPLDGSKILQKILQEYRGETIEDSLKEYGLTATKLVVPNVSITYVQRQQPKQAKVMSNMMLDLISGFFYYTNGSDMYKFRTRIHKPHNEQCIVEIYDREAVQFRDFADVDPRKYMCHLSSGVYKENISSLQLPSDFERYDLEATPGPLRPLFFTMESAFQPRFLLYNGEKMAEWIGVFPWLKSSGKFHAYVIKNPHAPHKAGYSMAPEDNFFQDDSLDFSVLDHAQKPSLYRSTIAIVYKEDTQLHQHFLKLGAQRIL